MIGKMDRRQIILKRKEWFFEEDQDSIAGLAVYFTKHGMES